MTAVLWQGRLRGEGCLAERYRVVQPQILTGLGAYLLEQIQVMWKEEAWEKGVDALERQCESFTCCRSGPAWNGVGQQGQQVEGQEMRREPGTHCQGKRQSLPGMVQSQPAPEQRSPR